MKRFFVSLVVWTALFIALVPLLWAVDNVCSSPITIDHTQVGETISNFPLMIRFTDNRFKYISSGGHSVSANNGYDVRLYSDASCTTALTAYELDSFNGTTGAVSLWNKRTSISSTVDGTFYICNGNSALNTDGSSAATTWSNGFISIYHFRDGTTLSAVDSLGAHNGTISGPTATTGLIGGGASYNGTTDKITIASAFIVAGLSKFSVSGWVQTSGADRAATYTVYTEYAVAANQFIDVFCCSNSAGYTGRFTHGRDASDAVYSDVKPVASTSANDGTWHYVVAWYDSSVLNELKLITDNALVDANITSNNVFNGASPASIIGNFNGSTTQAWSGPIDEYHLASDPDRGLSDPRQWYFTEYNNQKPSSTMLTLGSESCIGSSAARPLVFAVQTILNFLGL